MSLIPAALVISLMTSWGVPYDQLTYRCLVHMVSG